MGVPINHEIIVPGHTQFFPMSPQVQLGLPWPHERKRSDAGRHGRIKDVDVFHPKPVVLHSETYRFFQRLGVEMGVLILVYRLYMVILCYINHAKKWGKFWE